MKKFLTKLKNEEGFGGHQEFFIVIAMVGIIAAIAIPQLVKHWDRIPWLILLACGAGIGIFWAGIAIFKTLRKRSQVGIRIWSMKTGETLLNTGGHVTVKHLAFSSDGQRLSSFDKNRMFRAWEISTGIEVVNQEIRGRDDWLTALSPDLRYIAFGLTEGVIHIREIATKKLIFKLRGHKRTVLDFSFSPDGKILASAGEDKTVHIWNLENGSRLLILKGQHEQVSPMGFSSDGQLLACARRGRQIIELWQVPSGEMIRKIETDSGLASLAFSQDKKFIASAGWGGIISLWDVSTGREYRRFEGLPPFEKISALTFSPDNTLLVSGSSDHTVRLWKLDQGKEIIKLRGNWEKIASLVFSPDGQLLAAGLIVKA